MAEYQLGSLVPEDDDSNWKTLVFPQGALTKIDPTLGIFEFVAETGEKITLTKVQQKYFNFDAF